MTPTRIHWGLPQNLDGTYVVIQDPLAVQPMQQPLRDKALGVITLKEHGEAVKTLKQAACLYEELARLGLKRNGWLLGIGGGTLGDLVGFVAATWLRGIAFSLIPTTLLAMIDSSIGGKTGVNLHQGKNLVGAFHPPERLFLDLNALRTLPPRAFNAGMAEALKLALLQDVRFFQFLKNAGRFHPQHPQLKQLIQHCIATKQRIVAADPQERYFLEPQHPSTPTTHSPNPLPRDRRALNIGHTLAHALEQATGYASLLHGEAVSIGLCETLRTLAAHKNHPDAAFLAPWVLKNPATTLKEIQNILELHALPTTLPPKLDASTLHAPTHLDKKTLHP